MRLVVSIAGKYRGEGMEFEDLICEGVAGLLEGIRRFDPDKGYELSTYATFWVRKAILGAWVWQSRSVRLPRGIIDDLYLLQRRTKELRATLGRWPTTGELARATELSHSRVEELIKARRYTLSLNAPAGGSQASEEPSNPSALGEILPDVEQEEEPSGHVLFHERHSALSAALAVLPEMDRYILSARYGLDGRERATLREVAARVGISTEGVRQRQKSAEARLKEKLQAYLKAYEPQASEEYGRAS